MVVPVKLGVALAVALASNVSLFSMLIFPRESSRTTSTTPTYTATTTTASSSTANGGKLREDGARLPLPDSLEDRRPNHAPWAEGDKLFHDSFHSEETKGEEKTRGQISSLMDAGVQHNEFEPVEAKKIQTVRPATDENSVEEFDHEKKDSGARRDVDPGTENGLFPGSEKDFNPGSEQEFDSTPEKQNTAPRPEHINRRYGKEYPDPEPELKDPDVQPQRDPDPESGKNYVDPRSPKDEDQHSAPLENSARLASKEDLYQGSERKATDTRPQSRLNSRFKKKNPNPKRRRGDIDPEAQSRWDTIFSAQRGTSEGTLVPGKDPEYQIHEVVGTLTGAELEQFDSATAEVLIPELRALESLILRELAELHEVTQRQELRLQRLEQGPLRRAEVQEAIQVIREEQRKLQGLTQGEELTEQQSSAPPGTHLNSSAVKNIQSSEADDRLEQTEDSGDGSGSGEETILILETAVSMTTVMTTTSPSARTNTTKSSDEMIINHIYEMYNSLTSVEHKVIEVDSRLTSVASEVYHQRSTFVRLEDRVGEIGRNQKNLHMRSTMDGFKLSELEQFKGQAEVILGSAEGTVDQCDARLEVFTDRIMEQQDELEIMRDVSGRLKQMSNELRSADAYKARDVQELKQAYQQVETRLNNMHHALDQSVGNIRWDFKTYLDNLCISNDLQC